MSLLHREQDLSLHQTDRRIQSLIQQLHDHHAAYDQLSALAEQHSAGLPVSTPHYTLMIGYGVISTESIGDSLRRVLRQIMDAIVSTWRLIVQWFTKLLDRSDRDRDYVESVNAKDLSDVMLLPKADNGVDKAPTRVHMPRPRRSARDPESGVQVMTAKVVNDLGPLMDPLGNDRLMEDTLIATLGGGLDRFNKALGNVMPGIIVESDNPHAALVTIVKALLMQSFTYHKIDYMDQGRTAVMLGSDIALDPKLINAVSLRFTRVEGGSSTLQYTTHIHSANVVPGQLSISRDTAVLCKVTAEQMFKAMQVTDKHIQSISDQTTKALKQLDRELNNIPSSEAEAAGKAIQAKLKQVMHSTQMLTTVLMETRKFYTPITDALVTVVRLADMGESDS